MTFSQAYSFLKFKYHKFLKVLQNKKVDADLQTVAQRLSICQSCPIRTVDPNGIERCGVVNRKGCGCPLTKIVVEENYRCPEKKW